MKKVFGLALVTAIVMGSVPLARSLDAPIVPPGIDAGDWIPMGNSAGFVVSKHDSSMGSAAPVGVVKGYFMVRRGNTWLRIDSAPDYGVRPAMH
jgi:hypothetical protein